MFKIIRRLIFTIIFITIIYIIINTFGIQDKIYQTFYPLKYSEHVYKYSEEYSVDPLLTFAIIKAESNFNEEATSRSGAIGLMQLMEATADEVAHQMNISDITVEELYTPETNIQIRNQILFKII